MLISRLICALYVASQYQLEIDPVKLLTFINHHSPVNLANIHVNLANIHDLKVFHLESLGNIMNPAIPKKSPKP